MIYVGIDVAKQKHQIAILDDGGEIYRDNLVIQNNYLGFQKLHEILSHIQTETAQECQVALEDTGHYSLPLLQFLRKNRYLTYCYNPILIKEFSKVHTLRKTKTDKIDALMIAKKLMVDWEKREKKQNQTSMELKELTRHRRRMGKHQSFLKTQYTRILEKGFPKLATYGQVRHSAYMIKILKKYPSPKKIAAAHLKTLSSLLGANNSQLSASKLQQLANESIGYHSEVAELELIQTIEQLYLYEKQIKKVDKRIQEIMDILDSPIVTIPGISYQLGSIILAEIGDIHNFKTSSQLLAFAGMEPSIYESGEGKGKGKMVKRGSPYLRWAMYHAARLVAIYSPTFKRYYKKKQAEGKHYNVVISHLAKKLIRVIFHLLRKEEPYKEAL
ncbi:putative Mini-circle transposase for [Streptomyces afghaniensis 772] [Streptomyces afghaniensis]